jgi:hypothetical protein
LGDPWFEFRQEQQIDFYLFEIVLTKYGAHQASYSIGTKVRFQAKATGAWFNHLSPPSVEVKDESSYKFSSPIYYYCHRVKTQLQ